MSEWIKSSDSNPECTGSYLCSLSRDGKVFARSVQVYFQPSNMPDGVCKWDIEFCGTQGITVTHWMPLPDAP